MIVVFLVILLTLPQTNGGDNPVRGRYTNYDYGYSVTVPKSLIGFNSPAPAPNHGFGIEIHKPAKAYLDIDASYNALFWDSYDEAIGSHVKWLRDKGAYDIRIVKRAPTHLGTLKGTRVVIRCRQQETNKPLVRELLLAFRRNSRSVAIVYTLELTTPESRYQQDRKMLASLERSWKIKPLPSPQRKRY